MKSGYFDDNIFSKSMRRKISNDKSLITANDFLTDTEFTEDEDLDL